MSTYLVVLAVGVFLVLFGAVLLVRYPDRKGGTVKALTFEVNAPGAGIVVIVVGVAALVYSASQLAAPTAPGVPQSSGVATPAVLSPTLPPGDAVQTLACTQEGRLRSPPGDNSPTTIRFYNAGPRLLLVFWLNFNGERELFETLQPYQDVTVATYVGHAWLAADESANCVGIYLPARQAASVTIR